MLGRLWSVIPDSFHRNTIGVVVTIFLRALLNFIGVATLLPVLMLIVSGDGITSSNYLYNIYNTLNFSNYTAFVVAVCLIVVTIIVLKNLLNLMLHRYERDYIFNLYKYLSNRLFTTYFHRGFGFIKQSNSATLTRNINSVSLTFVAGVLKPLATIISEGLLLLLIVIMLALFYPYTALVICAIFAPIAMVFYMVMRRRLQVIGTEENQLQRTKNRIVSETFKGYVDIEMSDAFDHMLNKFNNIMNDVVDLRKRHATLSTLPQLFSEVGLVIGLVVLVLFGVLHSDRDMALLFGVFAIAAVRLIPSLRGILTSWSSIRFNRYTIDILCDVDDKQNNANISPEPLTFEKSIELRDVSFHYDDSQEMILRNISLHIDKGECVGVRGSSGVGKTTLFNIILGLHTPTSGDVYVDGVKLCADNIRSWQSKIGYVSQSVFIADMTLAENIALGCSEDDIDYTRVNEILRLVNLEEFVATLPLGVHSRIGEQGCRISGGQRQRIGIARALYKGAEILLFDEATSSLDSKTEESINDAIRMLSAKNNLTIVIIAHRESSLEYCNRIITL